MTRFLEVLRQRIGADLGSFEDLQTGSQFGSGRRKNGIWASRGVWSGNAGGVPFVGLCWDPPSDHWFLGVSLDSGSGDTQAADSLSESLRERLSRQSDLRGSEYTRDWPWYRFLEEHRDWSPLLVRLHGESQEPGELTKWFSQQFVETAKLTIPAIDEVLQITR